MLSISLVIGVVAFGHKMSIVMVEGKLRPRSEFRENIG